MEDEFKAKWKISQIAGWKQNKEKIVLFFKRFELDISKVYIHVTSIDYDRMQAICYLLSKMEKAIKICDFLDTLEKQNNDDVDVIKIYILISHAEITSRNLGGKGSKIALVKKFFKPVEQDLIYRIIPSFSSNGKIPAMDFADILYKIRCEYTHEGNYLGRIFKKIEDKKSSLLFPFKDGNRGCFGECGITYREFLNIYMRALLENIKTFSSYS